MGRGLVPGFAANLKRIREGKGISVEDLATASGIHWDSIYRIEREDRAPSLRVALDLANALGVTIDELCGKGGHREGKGQRSRA